MTDPKPPTAEERVKNLANATCADIYDPVWLCLNCTCDEIRAAEQAARAEGRREMRDKAEKKADEICECGGTYCLAHLVTIALDEGGGEQ